MKTATILKKALCLVLMFAIMATNFSFIAFAQDAPAPVVDQAAIDAANAQAAADAAAQAEAERLAAEKAAADAAAQAEAERLAAEKAAAGNANNDANSGSGSEAPKEESGTSTPPANNGGNSDANSGSGSEAPKEESGTSTPPANNGGNSDANSGSGSEALKEDSDTSTPPANNGGNSDANSGSGSEALKEESDTSTPPEAPAEYNVIYMSAPYGNTTAVEILKTQTSNKAIVVSNSPDVTAPEGFTMTGWAYENGTDVNYAATQTADITLYPVFFDEFKVTYMGAPASENPTVAGTEYTALGNFVKMNAPTTIAIPEGFNAITWQDANGNEISAYTALTNDITLYPEFTSLSAAPAGFAMAGARLGTMAALDAKSGVISHTFPQSFTENGITYTFNRYELKSDEYGEYVNVYYTFNVTNNEFTYILPDGTSFPTKKSIDNTVFTDINFDTNDTSGIYKLGDYKKQELINKANGLINAFYLTSDYLPTDEVLAAMQSFYSNPGLTKNDIYLSSDLAGNSIVDAGLELSKGVNLYVHLKNDTREFDLKVTFKNIGGKSNSTYTVSYNAGDTIAYPSAVSSTAPSLVHHDNTSYVFMGWEVGKNYNLPTAKTFNIKEFYAGNESGTKTVTLTAVYAQPNSDKLVNTYTVVYKDENIKTISPETIVELPIEGDVSKTVIFPTISGYTLKGLSTDASATSLTINNKTHASGTTFTVNYEKNTDTAYYEVKVLVEDVNGAFVQDLTKTVKGTAKDGDTIDYKTLAASITPAGFEFDEEKTKAENSGLISIIADSTSHKLNKPLGITIAFKRTNVTITFKDNSGGELAEISGKYGTPITLPDAVKSQTLFDNAGANGTFTGLVSDSGDAITIYSSGYKYKNFPATFPAKNVTYMTTYANSKVNDTIKVVFLANGGILQGDNDIQYVYNFEVGNVFKAPTASYGGYELVGWVVDKNGNGKIGNNEKEYTGFGQLVTQDLVDEKTLTLIAKWAPKSASAYYAVEHKFANANNPTYITYHEVAVGDKITQANVFANKLTSVQLVSNAGWNAQNTYIMQSSDMVAGFEGFADGEELTQADIDSVYGSSSNIKTIATITYTKTEGVYPYTVRYVDDEGQDIQAEIERSKNKKQYATEYVVDITNYEFQEVLVDGEKVKIASNYLTINAEEDKVITFVYKELTKKEEYTINVYYTENGNKVTVTDTAKEVVGMALNAKNTTFVQNVLNGKYDNLTSGEIFAGRTIKSTSVTTKIIKADKTQNVFNIELSNKADLDVAYDVNAKNIVHTFDNTVLASADVNIADRFIVKNAKGSQLTGFTVTYSLTGNAGSYGELEKLNLKEVSDSKLISYKITHPSYTGNIKGQVKVNIKRMPMTITVPNAQTTQGTALTQAQIDAIEADVQNQINSATSGHSNVNRKLTTTTLSYNANLLTSAVANAGTTQDLFGLVYNGTNQTVSGGTYNMGNYQVTVYHGDLIVNAITSNNQSSGTTDATDATPAPVAALLAAAPAAVPAAATPVATPAPTPVAEVETTDIADTQVPQAAAPETTQETTDIGETQLPTAATADEKGNNYWPWLLGLIVLAGGTFFVIAKKRRTGMVEEEDLDEI